MHDTRDFLDFLSRSPSSFHAAAELVRRFEEAGFRTQHRDEEWDEYPGGHVLRRDGAVIAWWVPEDASPRSGFRILGSHTDSPGFLLKPEPEILGHDVRQAAVEVYGGPIIPSWFDRDLAFAGRVILTDGSEQLVHTGPIARIPHLAIHLDRSGEFHPDRQRDTQPLHALLDGGTPLLEHIAEGLEGHVQAKDICAYDLITVDTQPPAIIGTDGQFIASGRLDNLSSVHASLLAFLRAAQSEDAGEHILVYVANDHEEVGSNSPTGAAGPLLGEVLQRIALSLGARPDEVFQMLSRSSCVSADAAHAVHPNHPEKHDPTHLPRMGGGPVLKVNANQRYASTARTSAILRRACQAAGVALQVFAGNNSVPCGSTIGPITATRLGIDTVDVGVPLLSMHSARELMGVADQLSLARALEAYLIG
ncbi:M18 family aminopeptidase [Corynebacterium uropygiale]|uniref:M18 family aminopeptidase n=1 Tax=Corynebacterium uropygiale TaxID=1775911 RepID=A0A9X1U0B9_9CORY|nr:M18 family aminopeptidase [Corynebacterium uropygiale]MCF4006649.1 M18 family aminopeptidase [Corynebacterium uropygiale]